MVKKVDGKKSFNWLFAVLVTYMMFFIFSYSYFNIAGYVINESETFALNSELDIFMVIIFLIIFFIFVAILFFAYLYIHRYNHKIKNKRTKRRVYKPFNY